MLSRSIVLSAAWAAYRLARPAFYAAGDTATARVFLRPLFGKMLRRAWAEVKAADADSRRFAETEATAAAFVAAQHRVRATALRGLDAGQRSARLSAVRDELALLDYAPLGVRIADRRSTLNAELAALSA